MEKIQFIQDPPCQIIKRMKAEAYLDPWKETIMGYGSSDSIRFSLEKNLCILSDDGMSERIENNVSYELGTITV